MATSCAARAMELFLKKLVEGTCNVAQSRQAKTLVGGTCKVVQSRQAKPYISKGSARGGPGRVRARGVQGQCISKRTARGMQGMSWWAVQENWVDGRHEFMGSTSARGVQEECKA
eukprot:1076363-Pelagomonas_calceolata.AAC.1